MDQTELQAILADHAEWLADNTKGKRADLSGADLSGADLSGADLSGADLSGADLRGANLRGADLQWADLSGADLRGANLSGADLREADLREADLRGADLREANLRGADLRWAKPPFSIDQTTQFFESDPVDDKDRQLADLTRQLEETREALETMLDNCPWLRKQAD